MSGAYPMYDQGMAYPGMDPYGYASYGMMGYGGVPPYAAGVTYPTIDYSGWSGRGAGNCSLLNFVFFNLISVAYR